MPCRLTGSTSGEYTSFWSGPNADVRPARRSAQSLGRNVVPDVVMPQITRSASSSVIFPHDSIVTVPTLLEAVRVWERHFREPDAAFARAKALVADATQSPATRAWHALTIAFHFLFFTAEPLEARPYLAQAKRALADANERRGELLADIGLARLAIVQRAPDAARESLLALYAEAKQVLPSEDRFWLLNAIGAAHYFTDRLDDAIRYLYEALESLGNATRSPQHPAVMSNLAAALVTVGDYAPSRELAETALAELVRFDNPQLVLFARSNLAEALSGLGESDRALEVCDAMLGDVDRAHVRATQNHYVAIAAEIYARYGRLDDAERCAARAQAILAEFPGGFNPVHAQWARAAVADARGDDDAIAQLDAAANAAASHRHLPCECQAWSRPGAP